MKFLAEYTSSSSLEPFRVPEFLAVADALNASICGIENPSWWRTDFDNFFFIFECDSVDAVRKIAERCVLLRAVHILLGCAPTIVELQQRNAAPSENLIVGEDENQCSTGDYHYQVESIGKKYSDNAKKKLIETIGVSVRHKGNVSWSSTVDQFFILIFHASPDEQESVVFFTLLVTESARCSLLSKYDLRKRPYIGTTSMPPEESIVMANMCRIKSGGFVYDPFCGTGSLLVAAAHFGAHTFGSDADGRSMRGGSWKFQASPQMQQQRALALKNYTRKQLSSLSTEELSHPTMLTNFKLYGLRLPERIRFNFSLWEKGFSSGILRAGVIDGIVSDPPYGLREPRRKVMEDVLKNKEAIDTLDGTLKKKVARPSTSHYTTTDMITDLIRFAADFLVEGGYIAFWHPTSDRYSDDELPFHPSMRIISNIPQRLSLKVIRRLVVMQKIGPVPKLRPDRAMCAPRRNADNLRELMNETSLPGNPEYTQYRMKVARRREAATQYWNGAQQHSEGGISTAVPHACRSNRRGQKSARTQTQEGIVANRERKILIRQEKQHASHLQNGNEVKEHGWSG